MKRGERASPLITGEEAIEQSPVGRIGGECESTLHDRRVRVGSFRQSFHGAVTLTGAEGGAKLRPVRRGGGAGRDELPNLELGKHAG